MDILSGLPDDVVLHILSFIPTKISILSNRWWFHWAHIPFFRFTSSSEDPVNTFRIGSGTSDHEFESWIETHVVKPKVRDLVIDLNYQLTLPRRLFTCESLVYLRILDCGGVLKEDIAVSFPSLKKLELVNVGYDSDKSLIHLLSGCPVLEELMLERLKVKSCSVFSPSITRLVIDVDDVKMLAFHNPSLRYLRLCLRKCEILTRLALGSLIEADIDLIYELNSFYAILVIDFVDNLYNVKCLKLSTRRINVANSWFSHLLAHKFHNLTDLNLRTDWRFITKFFEKANNLRVLTILRTVDHNTQCWIEPKQVPECLTSHLESVTVVDFEWSSEHEFDMVKYILKNGKVLKKVEIVCTSHYELDSDSKREAFKRIAMFEIGSQTCQLSFVYQV